MGCGASSDTSRVQEPTLNKKSVLPPIDQHTKKKASSAKSNGSADSGIEDSDPIRSKTLPSRIPVPIDNLQVEHQKKSRLGYGETFDIIATPKPGSLAPLRNAPKFLAAVNKPTPTIDPDLQAKLAAKQERASRKRQEIEEARRLASSRLGQRPITKPVVSPTPESNTTTSKLDERHQHLAMLRDKLRQSASHNSLYDGIHSPRTPRNESVSSGMTDIGNLTPRRGGTALGATIASNFKPVYD
ncbi:unnamed protein product [Adineta steineri]|uniref:Uncharacterized protein n=1 Tax=Adineta steineri TaxID=433720 RepID=A0A814HI07_9BILA|nr:unnamed protein product [Adineta steineri]